MRTIVVEVVVVWMQLRIRQHDTNNKRFLDSTQNPFASHDAVRRCICVCSVWSRRLEVALCAISIPQIALLPHDIQDTYLEMLARVELLTWEPAASMTNKIRKIPHQTMSVCKHALHKNSKNFGASRKRKKGEPKDHLGWQAIWLDQPSTRAKRETDSYNEGEIVLSSLYFSF